MILFLTFSVYGLTKTGTNSCLTICCVVDSVDQRKAGNYMFDTDPQNAPLKLSSKWLSFDMVLYDI